MMTFAGEEVFMRGLMQTSTTTICGEVGGGGSKQRIVFT